MATFLLYPVAIDPEKTSKGNLSAPFTAKSYEALSLIGAKLPPAAPAENLPTNTFVLYFSFLFGISTSLHTTGSSIPWPGPAPTIRTFTGIPWDVSLECLCVDGQIKSLSFCSP